MSIALLSPTPATPCPDDVFTPAGDLEPLIDAADLTRANYGERSTVVRAIRKAGIGLQLARKGRVVKLRRRDLPLLVTQATGRAEPTNEAFLFTPNGDLEPLMDVSALAEAGYGTRTTMTRVVRDLSLGIQLAGQGRIKVRKRDVPLLLRTMTDTSGNEA